MLVDKIKIISYKTVVSEQQLDVDPKITVFIGGNETGKTNVLEAINKFSLNNNFEIEDISRSTNRYRRGTLPNVGIVFSLSEEDQQKLASISPIFQDSNKLEIWKKGNGLNAYHVVVSKEKIGEISSRKEPLQKQIETLSKEVADRRKQAEDIIKKINAEKERLAKFPETKEEAEKNLNV